MCEVAEDIYFLCKKAFEKLKENPSAKPAIVTPPFPLSEESCNIRPYTPAVNQMIWSSALE